MLLKVAAALILTVGLLLWLAPRLERRMVFLPTATWDVAVSQAEPAREITLLSRDGVQLSALWMPAGRPRATLVYAHGNAGNLSHRIPTAVVWRRELGVSILLFDYRGYGHSQGTPSEEGIFLDTLAAYKEAAARGPGLPILLGRSLGTVPATRVAASRPVRALILDSPLASATAMARQILPFPGVRYLLSYRLDNLNQIRKIQCPVLVIHGERDKVVPLEQGQQVYQAAPQPKAFIRLKAMGHNEERTQPELLSRLRVFLDSLG